MNRKFLWLFFLFPLFGCQSQKGTIPQGSTLEVKAQSSEKSFIEIKIKNESFLLKNSDNSLISYQEFGKIKSWISNFPITQDSDPKNFIERRKVSFTDLFFDERDPYTGKLNKKSKCLKKVETQAVYFNAGAESNWADCSVNKTAISAIRLWVVCGKDLWEITLGQEKKPIKIEKIQCHS